DHFARFPGPFARQPRGAARYQHGTGTRLSTVHHKFHRSFLPTPPPLLLRCPPVLLITCRPRPPLARLASRSLAARPREAVDELDAHFFLPFLLRLRGALRLLARAFARARSWSAL